MNPVQAALATTEDYEPPEIRNGEYEIRRRWPALPPAAMHGPAGDLVRLAQDNTEADPAAILATALARAGAEMGPDVFVPIGETRHAPRLFVAVVGNTSKGRKGESAKPAERLFSLTSLIREGYLPAHTSPGPLSTGEGLIFRVRDEVTSWQVDKKTGEGSYVVTDPGEENKKLYVQDPELAAALQCTRRDGNTLSCTLRTLWDSGNAEPLTKSNRTKCTGAHVVVVCHITLPELAKLLAETELLNGFANRFLWVCARRQRPVPIPEPMDQTRLEVIHRRVMGAIEKCSANPGPVQLSPEARKLYIEIYPTLSEEKPGLAGAVTGRAEAQVIRLSLVYALLDSAERIEVEHLRAALAFWEYCSTSAEYVFGGRGQDTLSERVLSALEKGPLTPTDIHRLTGNHVSSERIRHALEDLVAGGRVIETQEPTGGRPKTVFCTRERTKKANKGPAGDEVVL